MPLLLCQRLMTAFCNILHATKTLIVYLLSCEVVECTAVLNQTIISLSLILPVYIPPPNLSFVYSLPHTQSWR
jgi:hypothetical protein